jgi:hypothetical protein
MIRGKHEQTFASETRRHAALDGADAMRQLFQPSETPLRLRERIEAPLRFGFYRAIQVMNFFQSLF